MKGQGIREVEPLLWKIPKIYIYIKRAHKEFSYSGVTIPQLDTMPYQIRSPTSRNGLPVFELLAYGIPCLSNITEY